MKEKILIIGNFGYYSDKLNGQTMRTRSIYQLLINMKNKYNFHVSSFDTSINKKKITQSILYYLKFSYYYFNYDTFVIMPAQRAVGIVLPLFFYSSVLFQKKVHFVAIGGWIGDLLNRNPIYKKYVKSFRGIYVQTNSLKHKLEEMGLSNTIYFPNFRIYNDNDIINKIEISKIDKIVLYSRITKEKGVELAIDTIDEINKRRNLTIRLSIYGPIEPSYKERFKRIIHNKENILYKGIIQPDKVKQTLSSYDLLLFPTYYEGEGFPGTILDAMSAGVPIIASDWKYNSEIIVNEYTGLLFEVKNRSDLMNKLNFAIKNPSLINQMRINCIDESKKFCADNVGLILINSIQKAEKLNR